MKAIYTFEYLEAYLDGQLSDEQVRALETDLATDADLQQAIEQHRQTRKAVQLLDQLETRAEIGQIYQQGKQETPIRSMNFQKLAIAAGLILLVTMGLLYVLGPRSIDAVQLADANFDAYPDRITAMSDQNLDSLLQIGLQAYNSTDYQLAIEAFSGLPADHPQADLIQLYSGIAEYQTSPKAAITTLKALKASGGSLESTASWYLALAYLKNKEKELAKAELTFLDQKGDYRNTQVKELLQQLARS
ncbi:MAG: hypothetical protein AAFV80_24305 [Bacteroidota bacterium]